MFGSIKNLISTLVGDARLKNLAAMATQRLLAVAREIGATLVECLGVSPVER